MRFGFAAIACLALAACDMAGVPEAEPDQTANAAAEEIDEGQIALHSEGLVVGAESFFFRAGRSEVDAALTKVLGEPLERLDNPDCGAGPMQFSTFAGGLTANYQEGSLVGWLLRDGGALGEEAIAVDANVSVGVTAEALKATSGYSDLEDSTLGEEFMLGDEIGGFVEDGRVASLHAGTQCFFR